MNDEYWPSGSQTALAVEPATAADEEAVLRMVAAGYRNETASNVVDVVVRSLRRKLGDESSVVETVRVPVRYRMPAHS